MRIENPTGLIRDYLDSFNLAHINELVLDDKAVEEAEIVVSRQHPEESPEQQHARAIARVAFEVHGKRQVVASPDGMTVQTTVRQLAGEIRDGESREALRHRDRVKAVSDLAAAVGSQTTTLSAAIEGQSGAVSLAVAKGLADVSAIHSKLYNDVDASFTALHDLIRDKKDEQARMEAARYEETQRSRNWQTYATWVWRAAIIAFLAMFLLKGARAQGIDVIRFVDSSSTPIHTFAGPFTFKCGTNLTCTYTAPNIITVTASGGGGSGTVTHTGNLTSKAVVIGNAVADIIVDTGCSTDGAGTMTCTAFSGSLTGNVTGNASGTAANLTGVVTTAHGGTGQDLSATGGTTKIIAQDASHVISARDLVAGDIPTLNQNTTGSAAKWTTARNLAGNSVDGSGNVAFSNKFIVQGTADSGLSGAQFMGALGTGIVKNTTTTGVLSIAIGSDLPSAIPIASVGSSGLSGTSPITISAAGAIGCATCTTNASALTAHAVVLGGGLQAAAVLASLGTTTTVLHGNASADPTFGAVVSADLNITTTTCTNQVVSAISATVAGTCHTVVGGDMASNTVTATQLAAQYANWQGCGSRGLGDGLNAIAAGTYLQFACVNDTGVTLTITGVHCWTDNAGTSTLALTNNAGTALLTGAVTCNATKASGGAAGTQSATTTLASGDAISFTFVADGTSKQTNWSITITY